MLGCGDETCMFQLHVAIRPKNFSDFAFPVFLCIETLLASVKSANHSETLPLEIDFLI